MYSTSIQFFHALILIQLVERTYGDRLSQNQVGRGQGRGAVVKEGGRIEADLTEEL